MRDKYDSSLNLLLNSCCHHPQRSMTIDSEHRLSALLELTGRYRAN